MIAETKLREFFTGDKFCLSNGVKIDYITPSSASASVELTENHRNAGGGVQGGLIFTLADFAFALHANAEGLLTVSQSASISYLRGAKGNRLIAEAKPVHTGRSTVTYEVTVKDDTGVSVALVIVNGFRMGENQALLS